MVVTNDGVRPGLGVPPARRGISLYDSLVQYSRCFNGFHDFILVQFGQCVLELEQLGEN